MSHNEQYIRSRVHLSADSLIGLLRERFDLIVDKRRSASTVFSLTDCLMSAFAMFSIKEDSLLAFDGRRNERNLKSLFQIQNNLGKFRTHKAYWKHLWACYTLLALRSWEELYRMIANGRTDGRIQLDTG